METQRAGGYRQGGKRYPVPHGQYTWYLRSLKNGRVCSATDNTRKNFRFFQCPARGTGSGYVP